MPTFVWVEPPYLDRIPTHLDMRYIYFFCFISPAYFQLRTVPEILYNLLNPPSGHDFISHSSIAMFSPVKITLTLLLSLATFAAADSSDTTGVAPGANPANVRSKANNDPSYSNSENFEESMLATHNKWRQEHSAGSVSWDPELATYAESISKRCEFRHSVGDSVDSYIPLILWGFSYDMNLSGADRI